MRIPAIISFLPLIMCLAISCSNDGEESVAADVIYHEDWIDLNKNGRLDPYEDSRLPIAQRVEDLLARMTVAEKAGLMFQTFARLPMEGPSSSAGDISQTPAGRMVAMQGMNHFNFPGHPTARAAAEWNNAMQLLAEGTRLGIPITFSSDPRHAFSSNPAVSARRGSFSQWPEPIGLAAIGDPGLAEAFADVARQEYLAVGIRVAMHPMADLATEPRWGRINGTFGEDAHSHQAIHQRRDSPAAGKILPGFSKLICFNRLIRTARPKRAADKHQQAGRGYKDQRGIWRTSPRRDVKHQSRR